MYVCLIMYYYYIYILIVSVHVQCTLDCSTIYNLDCVYDHIPNLIVYTFSLTTVMCSLSLTALPLFLMLAVTACVKILLLRVSVW